MKKFGKCLNVSLALLCFFFTVSHAQEEPEDTILIIVSSKLMKTGLISVGLENYQNDLRNEDWTSVVMTVNKNVDPDADYHCPDETDLKRIIRQFYADTIGVAGFVIVGSPDDIPTAYWHHHRERTVDNPTDLYYADMDEWVDLDGNGVYETWDSKLVNGTWEPDFSKPANPDNYHFSPELFFGRITAGPLSSSIEEEATHVAFYLDKIHDYRTNGSHLTNEQFSRGLFFRADEYCPNVWDLVYGHFVPHLFCNHGIMVSSPDDLAEELEKGYLSATIATHSGNDNHAMFKWKNAERTFQGFPIERINEINPKVHFVILFACYAADFTAKNFGAAYLFHSDYTLNVIGSSGPWGVLLDETCGQELNDGIPVGIVIRNYINRNSPSEDGWPKGILHGDPLIQYDVNNVNKPPCIKNHLNYLETYAGDGFRLDLNIVDHENDPVTVHIDSLPENAFINGTSLLWTPSQDQIGTTFHLQAKAIDNHTNSYTAAFSVYVNRIKNGLLNNLDGWTQCGNGNIYLTGFDAEPFKNKATRIETDLSWAALKQAVKIKPFRFYRLELWINNSLTINPSNAYIKINELNQKYPINEIIDPSIRYDDNFYATFQFYTGDDDSLTFCLYSGDESNITSGILQLSGLRLIDLGSRPIFLSNGDFECGSGNTPENWGIESFSKAAVFDWLEGKGRNNSCCARIEVAANQSDDARWIQYVHLMPYTRYKLSGWIKGENIVPVTGYYGANLSVIDLYANSPSLVGTFDWTFTKVEFVTPANGNQVVACRLGNFGSVVSGKAWYDDITLTPLDPIPVELQSFTGTFSNGRVLLNWSTASESNNYGFEIERKDSKSKFNIIGFIRGKGTSSTPQNYFYTDDSLKSSSAYWYRLKQIDTDGSCCYSNMIKVNVNSAKELTLLQNYPNPFNTSTVISYFLPQNSHGRVSLNIYNVLGERVRELVSTQQKPGYHKITWDGRDDFGERVGSGLYFYSLRMGNYFEKKKMLVIN